MYKVIMLFPLLTSITLNAATPKPIIWWSFDKVKDGIIYNESTGFPATLRTKNVSFESGYIGKCLVCKGNNSSAWSSKLSNPLALTKQQAFTITFWIKPSRIKRKTKHELVSKGKDHGPGWRMFLTYGRLVFRSGRKGNYPGGCIRTNENRIKFVAGKWFHIAVTKTPKGIMYLYVNGIEQARGNVTIHPENFDFRLGNMFGKYYQYEGAIDEFKFYDKAISPMDILKEANYKNMSFDDV